jgi:16S rRNA (uracil1498-N3)-methyltransferase
MTAAPSTCVPSDAGPVVLAADVGGDEVVVTDDDHHHLSRVRRLRPGDPVAVTDGRGAWRPGRFGRTVEPTGPVVQLARPTPTLAVGFALVKGERPELVCQKLTELGVDRIMPFVGERSVVRWDADRADRHTGRLRRVVREAVMQCRRVWLPTVGDPVPFAALATEAGAVRADPGGGPPTLERPVVLVGPEGGWSAAERAALPAAVTLGDGVLRAETAAIAAGAVLAALRVGIVGPPPTSIQEGRA